jgi:hypothetical protein
VDPHLLSFIKSTLNLPSNNIVSLLIKEGWPSAPSINRARFYNFIACKSSIFYKHDFISFHLLKNPHAAINAFKLLWK